MEIWVNKRPKQKAQKLFEFGLFFVVQLHFEEPDDLPKPSGPNHRSLASPDVFCVPLSLISMLFSCLYPFPLFLFSLPFSIDVCVFRPTRSGQIFVAEVDLAKVGKPFGQSRFASVQNSLAGQKKKTDDPKDVRAKSKGGDRSQDPSDVNAVRKAKNLLSMDSLALRIWFMRSLSILLLGESATVFVTPSLDFASSRLWWIVASRLVDEQLLVQHWHSQFFVCSHGVLYCTPSAFDGCKCCLNSV